MVEILEFAFALVLFGTLLGIVVVMAYFEYKTKKAMIEKGLVPEDEKQRPENRLGWGIVILGIGISLLIGWRFGLDTIAIGGLILASIGIALMVLYVVEKNR